MSDKHIVVSPHNYCGNVIYESGVLKRILVEGGYVEGGIYYFYLTDHLGNNRVVADASGSIKQSNHYYPYGMSFAEGNQTSSQPYKFGAKELDAERGLNLYDFGARWYDPVGTYFPIVDPLAEKYPAGSPYAYCINNPINNVDPTGAFSTKFGAWLYKLFNGGEQLLKDIGGEYFVSQRVEHMGGGAGITVERKFDWDGRNFGRNLKTEEQRNIYIADIKFQELIESHGFEYIRVESRSDAIAKVLQPALLTIMPTPLFKSGTAFVNSGSEAVEGTSIAKTPVGRRGNIMGSVAKSPPTTINGTKFTGHALEQMQARGIISPTSVLDVIKNPTRVFPGNQPGTMVYIKEQLKVVTNSAGDIITIIWQ